MNADEEPGLRQLLIVAEGFGFIALLLGVVMLGVHVVWWIALMATSFLPMIGKRHRHGDWEKLNR